MSEQDYVIAGQILIELRLSLAKIVGTQEKLRDYIINNNNIEVDSSFWVLLNVLKFFEREDYYTAEKILNDMIKFEKEEKNND